MAFKCVLCNQYKGSKARYKGGNVCNTCNKKLREEVTKK